MQTKVSTFFSDNIDSIKNHCIKIVHNKLTIYNNYFVTFFFTLLDTMFVGYEKKMTPWSTFASLEEYECTKKVATFFIWVYLSGGW